MNAQEQVSWTYRRCNCGNPDCERYEVNFTDPQSYVSKKVAVLACLAPQLLDSIRELLEVCDDGEDYPPLIRARALIAHAEKEGW